MGRLTQAPLLERTPADAAALSHALLGRADAGEAWSAGSLVTGPAVVLGARQRRAAVTTAPTVVRRRTTGTAAWLGGRALWCALALPSIDALYPDATGATILNRNVRPWLRGLTRSGMAAAYFGREWVAVGHRPAAVLGYEVSTAGALLVEMLVGWDEPVGLPTGWAAAEERAVERWRGRAPVAVGAGRDPMAVLGALRDAVAAQAGGAVEAPAPGGEAWDAGEEPATATAVEAPIGRVEAGWLPGGGLWLGGDALVATPWLDALGAALAAGAPWPTEGAAVDGARAEDWARAVAGRGGRR